MIRFARLGAIVWIVWSTGIAEASSCLSLAFPAESPNFKTREALAQTIYREAGLCVSVKNIPNKRIMTMLKRGELDGEVMRVESYLRQMPGLIPIPTPLTVFTGRLYWPAGKTQPTGKGQSIGRLHGWTWPDDAARRLNVTLVEMADPKQLFEMTLAGRIDGFLMAESDFHGFESRGLEGDKFTSIAAWQEPMLHAVTEKHADLVPKLDAAIKRLMARGEIARLIDGAGD